VTGARWFSTVYEGRSVSQAAAKYAYRRHAGQRRADGSPFILHPLEVARLLEGIGAPDHLVTAGILHDVIEKTDTTASELQERFGGRIAALVVAVSDDGRIEGYGRRKAALRRQVAAAGEEALTLFAADKVSKLRELRRESDGAPNGVPSLRRERRGRRVTHYLRSLALLEERLSSSRLVEQLREELDAYLEQLPTPTSGR
jgi:(p)ppGpp synthase/HD superfamily hydrolase